MKTNRIYSFLGTLIVLTLFCGNAWGANYTCSFTKLTTGDNITSYTASHTHSAGGVTWTVYGNQGTDDSDIRVGGKNTTATNRTLTSGQISIAVKKFTINHLGTGNGKDSEITINSIKLEVANNSSFTSADVITKNSPSVSSSGSLDYTPTTGTSWAANSYYRVTVNYQITGSNNCYIKISSFVCTEYAVPHTVTFNAQGGTCGTSTLTEASSGAGVTLPAATPSTSCTAEGWGFYGWATAQCSSSTTTAPTIVGKAGDTYYPSTDIPLHAVYAKGEYTKETSAITSGAKYLIVGNTGGHNYIMKSSSADFKDYSGYNGMDAAQIDETSTGKYHAAAVYAQWCYTIEGTAGNYFIRDVVNSSSSNYADIAYSAWWGHAIDNSDKYTITVSDGIWTIQNNYYDEGYVYFGLDDSDLAFFAYSSAQDILLYKETITPIYYSNPACCEDDPTIGGTAQLKTSGTFSLSQVDVECTSATVQSNCEWTDYGFIWSESVNTTATLQLNSDGSAPSGVTKVQVGTSGDASSFNGSLEKSSFETGHTYYYRAYVKNCYYDGSYVYSNTSTLASFTPYTISYNNNGESGTIDTKVVNTGGSVTLSDGTGFTKAHYHIDHWALNSAEGASHAKGSTYSSITANATFYAIWAINTHTLTWSFGTGGSSSETAGTHYTAGGTKDYGTAITYPSSSSMSRTGYTFSGWSTTTTTMPDEDLEISANWSTVDYDVTYHLNGGTGASDRTYTIETATFSLATPTRTGYQFDGWYANSDLSTGGVQTQITVGSTGDKEYWAKWTPNTYKVQFNANGGTGSMSDQNFTYDAPKKALSANTFTPATGKYFAGWSTTSSGDVEYTDKQSVNNLTTTNSATVKLYAVWADHTYTNYRTNCVTRYDITLDDGEVATTYNGSAKVIENGTSLLKLVAPTKTGYTMTGYYTSDGDLIAGADGKLEKEVTVSATKWTDEDGKWVKGEDATFYAHWSAKTYTITLNQNGATTDGTTSVDATYDSNTLSASISNPTKTGYTFGGWYSGVGGTGREVINSSGTLQNSVTIETIGWTDASGKWILDGTATLYANWTAKSTTVSFDTNSGTGATSDKTATYDAAMPTPITVPTRSGYYFGGYYDGEGGTGTQYYTASGASAKNWDKEDGSLKLYARWYGDLKAWCDPNVTVSGDIHLTSYKDLFVQSSSTAGNALNVTSTDWGSATEMEIAYLGAGDTEVAKGDSHFRLYGDNTNTAVDASSSSVDISASRTFNTDYSIRYTPSAFNTTNTYKLQLTFKKGEYTLKTVTHNLYGRGLPEEFVIAVKNSTDGYWYALPNTMASDNSSHTAPIKILVDDTTTPTSAVYAATTTVYKGQERNTANSNMQSIRFTTDGNNHLQASISTGTSNSTLKLPTSNLDGNQAFHLRSSNLAAYTVSLDPSATPAKKLGLYTSSSTMYMGYNESPSDYTIYFLPITNKYTPRDATAYEWGEYGVIVEADMTDVASATMHIDGASPTAATVTGINGSLGGTKYAKVDGGALTVGAVANDGKLLYIHWKNSGGTDVGVSQITMPCVIAADATMSDLSTDKASWAKKEVHILPGKTLTADGASFDDSNVTVPTMYVYPGATLDITTGKLTATTLRLRSGWTRAGTKEYNVARVHIADDAALSKSTGNFTLDYDIYDSEEGTHYYPIAVPFKVKVKDIDYVDPTLATASTYGKHYAIKRYNGAKRAEFGAIDDNWELVPDEEELEDVYIRPSEGYIMTGVGLPAYGGCIIRFPLDANDNWTNDGEKASYSGFDKNIIAVTHHTGAATEGGGANKRHEGWNMLANPYMSCFATKNYATHDGDEGTFITGKMTLTGDPSDPYGWDDEDDNIYVSIPTHDFSEYLQYNINDGDTKLLPGWSFFIQAADEGNVTFAVAGQQASSDLPIYAPKRTAAEQKVVKTGIVLSSETASDKTTFLISDRYSSEYEIGADLEKMFGNGYTLATYSINNDTRLAFNAMSTAQANELIPIGVRLPADGEYTFSLNERYADADIERLDLIDYETGEVTDLMATDYYFYATRSQNDERFALNVKRGKQTTTDIGGADIGAPDGARKILLNGTIFIVRDGLLYDATGKRVQTNK